MNLKNYFKTMEELNEPLHAFYFERALAGMPISQIKREIYREDSVRLFTKEEAHELRKSLLADLHYFTESKKKERKEAINKLNALQKNGDNDWGKYSFKLDDIIDDCNRYLNEKTAQFLRAYQDLILDFTYDEQNFNMGLFD